ncbi:MAG: 2-oxoacid:acceptor oxidoreductase family protein [Nitrospinae bacterium]|nr:2-oxoacid:acceptor oxidoreductase family protein [Nitrospinota bacterium]
MLRVRSHGRGGQGIKTASQILGTAAFLSGYQSQDFPLYGAERRGAPIVAFTRISQKPILERGPISIPDLLLIGDETLLEDPQAAPLCGSDKQTVVFVNSTKDSQVLKESFNLSSLPVTRGLTRLCLQYLNDGMVRSTALAAAGARLTGLISLEDLLESVEIELEAIGIAGPPLQSNLDLVREVFGGLDPVTIKEREESALSPSKLMILEQKEVRDAAPLITATGNMVQRKTGNWRIHRPEIDYEDCNNCMICYARCPEGVIEMDPEGKPVIDYDHCKGCMICAQECPKHSIKTLWEMDYELEPQ